MDFETEWNFRIGAKALAIVHCLKKRILNQRVKLVKRDLN
jgi:hypothetical protein